MFKFQSTGLFFPIRVASIDIGSNAIRFLATEFYDHNNHNIIYSERAPLRLGQSVFSAGALNKATIENAIAVLSTFQLKMKNMDIHHYRAVATSAVREASNGMLFVEEVQLNLGMKIEIISGSEEARLVYLAVQKKVPLAKKDWILTDLGGGSAEISQIHASGIQWTETRGVGAVRLLEEFHRVKNNPEKMKKILSDFISIIKIPHAVRSTSLIATGGNIEKIANLVKVKTGRNGTGVIQTSQLRHLVQKLSKMTIAQRMKKLALKEDRADVILPAAMVYEHIASLYHSPSILVPFVGLKEGIIYDIIDDLFTHKERSKQQEALLFSAAVNLGRRYNFEEPHNRHVARLSLSIFDQLKFVHGLSDEDRKILLAASMLHDVGTFINYKSHHKHSLYILSQSELPSLSSRQMCVAANIARYHRKSEPQASHPLFMKLSSNDRDTVLHLSPILRIADSLDKDHLQRVRDVKVRVKGSQVQIKPLTIGKTLLDDWSFEKKSKMFNRVYKMKVKLKK